MRDAVRNAFESKKWSGIRNAPRSGPGSTLEATASLRDALPDLFAKYKVKTFLDAPCGDWHWMREVDLTSINYIGADISSEVLQTVESQHAGPRRKFIHLDITSDPLPKADMMMCRDCLFHLKFWLRWAFFQNFVESEIPYLLTTMHHVETNQNLRMNGGFKWFNPCAGPFNFPDPLVSISETGEINLDSEYLKTRKGMDQRSLGVWSREQIADALAHHQPESNED
ncbi:hypothetical protein [Halocynthiibacter namhaensis]|uniref:hypothetical protein n=1 Tax=Halocynthiibacter namhaensis TaxID=1290553 RepID=UPI00068FCAC0|nr:hypothetical protein [Halocynthiibacter namhaensis]